MEAIEQLIYEQSCKRLYTDFANAVDNHLVDEAVQLFTEDGIFNRLGERVAGHEMLKDFFSSRDPAKKSHHICTNIRIYFTSPTTATGTCTIMLFTPGDRTPDCTLARYDDTLVLTSDGWKIKERGVSLVF